MAVSLDEMQRLIYDLAHGDLDELDELASGFDPVDVVCVKERIEREKSQASSPPRSPQSPADPIARSPQSSPASSVRDPESPSTPRRRLFSEESGDLPQFEHFERKREAENAKRYHSLYEYIMSQPARITEATREMPKMRVDIYLRDILTEYVELDAEVARTTMPVLFNLEKALQLKQYVESKPSVAKQFPKGKVDLDDLSFKFTFDHSPSESEKRYFQELERITDFFSRGFTPNSPSLYKIKSRIT